MSDFLSDVGTGLLDSAGTAARSYALSATEDSAALHPLIEAIAGAGPQPAAQPTPASRENPPALPANQPQPAGGSFLGGNKVLLALGAIVALAGAWYLVRKAR